MKIFLTRHGETEWNLEKRMQGRLDSPLTPRGIRQAQSLADRLKKEPLQAIFTSPSPRAVQTAQIIKGERDTPLRVDPDLFEMDLGDWEGRTQADIQQMEPEQFERFWTGPEQYRPVMGESFLDVEKRTFSFLSRLTEEYGNEAVLIVSHAVFLKVLLSSIEGRPMKMLWEEPYIHGASLSLVRIGAGPPFIEMYSDTSHLER